MHEHMKQIWNKRNNIKKRCPPPKNGRTQDARVALFSRVIWSLWRIENVTSQYLVLPIAKNAGNMYMHAGPSQAKVCFLFLLWWKYTRWTILGDMQSFKSSEEQWTNQLLPKMQNSIWPTLSVAVCCHRVESSYLKSVNKVSICRIFS